MTALPVAAAVGERPHRLKVSVNGSSREYDAPVSRLGKLEFHRTAEGWMLVDVGVADGLFLDGCRVHQLPLFAGRPVHVGVGLEGQVVELEVLPTPRPPIKALPAPAVVVNGLGVTTPEGRVLLDRVGFGLAPSSLTALIGPSGAGKSTLLHALTGQTTPTVGTVSWLGRDVHDEYDELRFRIGFVPQEEILHQQLTVRQGLTYAARLRLPAELSRAERDVRVDGVIAKMGLERYADQRIGSQLSGGQRKRVSIATELLTAPPLLFLDEPTSGLDPGMDRSVMHQMRALADEGRVVVVATHAVLGLDVCDTIVVLARGGRVAYAGPPAGVLPHFACDDYPQLFDLLESGDVPRHLPTRQKPARAHWSLLGVPAQSSGRQLATLIRRNLAVLFADRLHLAMLLLIPLALAGLSHVVQGDAGLSLRLTRTPQGLVDGGEAGQRLTILVIAAALMGSAMTIRELVGERTIFRREYAVGLSPGMYFLSKVVVLGSACFLQGLVVTWLALWGMPEQDLGGVHGWGWWEIGVPIALLAFTMALVGLWLSALVGTVEQTMPVLVGVVMSQLVLSSALVHLAGRPGLDQLSWLMPSRWAYAAGAVSANLERAKRGVPNAVLDPLFAFTKAQWTQNVLLLLAIALVAVWLGARATRRSTRL